MKTLLITGANGYLGSNLTKNLTNQYNVIVLVRNSDNLIRLNNILSKIKIYSTLKDNLEDVFMDNNIDIILHCATVYGRRNETIEEQLNTNYLLPFNLLQLGVKYGVNVFMNIDTVLDSRVSSYALTKSHIRDWLQFMSESIKVVNIQLEHFYGPGASDDNFISWVILKLLKNEGEIKLTKGEQIRNFLFIDDVTSAFTTILSNLDSLNNNYTNIQIASSELISIKHLVQLIKKITGSHVFLNFGAIPYRSNELMISETDNSLLKELGWNPTVQLKEGIRHTIDHIKFKVK